MNFRLWDSCIRGSSKLSTIWAHDGPAPPAKQARSFSDSISIISCCIGPKFPCPSIISDSEATWAFLIFSPAVAVTPSPIRSSTPAMATGNTAADPHLSRVLDGYSPTALHFLNLNTILIQIDKANSYKAGNIFFIGGSKRSGFNQDIELSLEMLSNMKFIQEKKTILSGQGKYILNNILIPATFIDKASLAIMVQCPAACTAIQFIPQRPVVPNGQMEAVFPAEFYLQIPSCAAIAATGPGFQQSFMSPVFGCSTIT
ncbi:hypothetical protein EJ110_NYTH32947 [Nymphaea thermarum]|nr:hypothetical protein EJ110_NYTH32947 [Nymphaea thermarum]